MPNLGEILREARKKKGISEEAASKALKIKVERLRDLEENRYDGFPAHVYVKSFLRLYAEFLGLEANSVLEQFNAENPPPERKPIFEITEEQRTRSAIERHVPNKATPFLLTPLGKVAVAIVFLSMLAGALGTWWLTKEEAAHQDQEPPSSVFSSSEPTPPAEPILPQAPISVPPLYSHDHQ